MRRVIYPLCGCVQPGTFVKFVSSDTNCKDCGGWGRRALWEADSKPAPAPTVAEFNQRTQTLLNQALPKRKLGNKRWKSWRRSRRW